MIVAILSNAVVAARASGFDPFGSEPNLSGPDLIPGVDTGPVIPEVQFNNDDISMVFQIISDATGWSIFPSAQVSRAKVSLWAKNITAKELLDRVVRLAGFVYHRQDNVISVMSYDEYMQHYGLAKQVLQLSYADAGSVATVVKPFLTKLGKSIVHKATNTIVLYEAEANLKSVIAIIKRLDTPAEDVVVEVLNLQYVRCEALASTLQQAFGLAKQTITNKSSDSDIGPKQRSGENTYQVMIPRHQIGIYPIAHTNQLIIVGTKSDVEKVKRIVAVIDVLGDEMVLEVIDLKYADAETVARTLQQVFAVKKVRDIAEAAPRPGLVPTGTSQDQTKNQLENQRTLATPQAQVGVFSIGRTNQLIVKAFKSDLERLKTLVARLDVFVEPVTKSYHFTYVDASEVYKGLERILNVYGRYGRSYTGLGGGAEASLRQSSGITLVQRTNSILLTGPPSTHRIMSSIKESIDTPGTYEAGMIRVYKIQNADVDEVAETIKELLSSQTGNQRQTRRTEIPGTRIPVT